MIAYFRRQTLLARQVMADHLRPGDSAIDATVGTGEDTLILAQKVGPQGRVYAFDIQEAALKQARAKLKAAGAETTVCFYQQSHALLGSLPEIEQDSKIRGAMFNLGYLPGGDHEIMTAAETTIPALEAALDALAAGGLMTVCAYLHGEGREEAEAVDAWCRALGQGIDVHRIETINHHNSPILYLVEKRRGKDEKSANGWGK
jgi:predicted methyltransferase